MSPEGILGVEEDLKTSTDAQDFFVCWGHEIVPEMPIQEHDAVSKVARDRFLVEYRDPLDKRYPAAYQGCKYSKGWSRDAVFSLSVERLQAEIRRNCSCAERDGLHNL